jgi:hypothetical protein
MCTRLEERRPHHFILDPFVRFFFFFFEGYIRIDGAGKLKFKGKPKTIQNENAVL